jgi:hypothetical protein
MKFERFSQWSEVSECGRYTVCGSGSGGRFTFQGWRRSDIPRTPATLLGTRMSAEAARELCVDDEAKREALKTPGAST